MRNLFRHQPATFAQLPMPVWIGAGALLVLPAVAMQFTDAVRWTPADFAAFATLLAVALGGMAIALRASGSVRYRLGAGMLLGGVALLLWTNGAVGLIGSERDPVNLMFLLVPLVGSADAVLARLRPAGMARTAIAMAVVQAAIGAGVLLAGVGSGYEVALSTALFGGLWLVAAGLFRRA